MVQRDETKRCRHLGDVTNEMEHLGDVTNEMEHLIRMKDYGFRGGLLQRHRAVALEQERSGDYRWCL